MGEASGLRKKVYSSMTHATAYTKTRWKQVGRVISSWSKQASNQIVGCRPPAREFLPPERQRAPLCLAPLIVLSITPK